MLAEEIRSRYAAIVESSDDAIIAKTLDGVVSAWNAAAERMFGYTEHEAIGQPITMIIPPDLYDEEHDILKRLRAGERVEHYETVRVTKAGERIDVSLTISPLRDPAGRIVGCSKIARDNGQAQAPHAQSRQSGEPATPKRRPVGPTLRAAPALWRQQAFPRLGARADTVRAACRTGA